MAEPFPQFNQHHITQQPPKSHPYGHSDYPSYPMAARYGGSDEETAHFLTSQPPPPYQARVVATKEARKSRMKYIIWMCAGLVVLVGIVIVVRVVIWQKTENPYGG